ncbi:hypothetical protein ACOMHN_020763 [Nucella lapillus]
MSRNEPTTSSDSTVRAGVDWEGNDRRRSYDQLVRMNEHIGPDYLLQICQRVGPLLDRLVPSCTYGVQSLLSAGSMSLLRTPETLKRNSCWKLSHQMVLQNGCRRVLPRSFVQPSFVQSVIARQGTGSRLTAQKIPSAMYRDLKLFDIKCGHLLATYCSIFDRTGQYVITGADDALVKIWHFHSGRLLATLRGHSAEVSDLDVSYENTLVVSGSYDKTVRVWCLQTKAPVAVLQGHTSMLTTVGFSPQCKGDTRILMSTGADGCVCFWLWNAATKYFNPKPKKFVERSHAGAKMLCAAFSSGGMFSATGSSDHVVRVYFLYANEPAKICELEAHSDMVGCISYSNDSNRFISGSDDGMARIWHFERQDWKDTALNMNTTLKEGKEVSPDEDAKFAKELNVTMVTWNCDDSMVVTAVVGLNINYVRIKVWEAQSGRLRHDLKGHENAVYVLDASPVDPRICLSSGHDGQIFIWDIVDGVQVKHFWNLFEGQGAVPIFDCKFTPDAQAITATDSYGRIMFFGFGDNQSIKKIPTEVFFHTDYRPLIRDANNFVLDVETQMPPHLMPPPYLVNRVGNPYEAAKQRLVPGRQNMTDDQLRPSYVISDQGISVVIGDGEVPEEEQVWALPAALAQNEQNHQEQQQQHLNNRRQRINNQPVSRQRQMANNNERPAVSNRRQPAPARPSRNTPQPRAQLGSPAAQDQPNPPQVVAQPQDHDYSRHRNEEANGEDGDTSSDDEGRAEVQWNDRLARSSIDDMIRQLQSEQDERIHAQGGDVPLASPPRPTAAVNGRGDRPAEGEAARARRGEEGQQEGEGAGNEAPEAGNEAPEAGDAPEEKPDVKPVQVVVRLLRPAQLKTSEEKRNAMAEDEIRHYIMERKKKQSVPNTPSTLFGNMSRGRQDVRSQDKKKTSKQAQATRNRLAARALYDTEDEVEENEESESGSESSYSDWTMEGSSNLQPPKRRSKRKPKRRCVSSSEDEDDDEEAELAIEYDDYDEDDNDDDNDDEDFKVNIKPSKKATEKKEEVKEEGKKKVPASSQDKREKKSYKPMKTPMKTVKREEKDSQATASSSKDKKTKKPSKWKAEIDKNNLPEVTELKPEFMPPEWLTGTIPRKTPFVPQMGDEAMYFRQGHELYLQAVEKHKSYEISSNISLPWQKNPHLRETELVKIVGIRYEVKPPRLCSLKLAYINPETGKMLGGSFSVRYHDMPDVIDFLVLRQHFDLACQRRWKPGDRFRSMIDDQWWMGKIEGQSPLKNMFPDSMFQCFNVQWDNGEFERLSPWDMEPVNESLLPNSVGGGVPVDSEELKGMLYVPKANEWSSAGYEVESHRILRGLEAVMGHSAAQPFNAPVDLSAFPLYAVIIEYPIDLSTIKARLENGYYRRINALQWDVRHIESNAKKFNEDGTPIFRSAGIVTDTLLKFIGDPSCQDPMPSLEQLSRGQEFNWGGRGGGGGGGGDADDGGGGDDSGDEGPSSSTGGSSLKRKRGKEEGDRMCKRSRRRPDPNPRQWKKECCEVLAQVTEREDSSPFLAPVDPDLYPNYDQIIQTPMDLCTVRRRLHGDEYTSPVEFAENVRLIFRNSREFNTNRKSRIYAMTARLSALFESLVHKILATWRALTKGKHSDGSSFVPSTSAAGEEHSLQPAASSHSRDSSSQEMPSGSRPGPLSESRSHTSGRSSEEDMRTLARNMVSRPADDTDSEKTEVEEEEETEEGDKMPEDNEETDKEKTDDNNNDDDDDDTEIEDNSNTSTPPVRQKLSAVLSSKGPGLSKSKSGSKKGTKAPASYRTRAKTGSLRPKRYISSDEEDERDVRKNGKRAPSHSSRDSSFQHDIEDVDLSSESSTGSESGSDSDSSTSKQRKHLSKLVHNKRRKAASKSRRKCPKGKKHAHTELLSEDDSDDDETDSDSDSEIDKAPRKAQPRRRVELDLNSSGSGKKPSGSGTRTTRNQGKRTFNYLEDSCDEYEDDPSRVSVSSRGRVRRMTKRARANRVDD